MSASKSHAWVGGSLLLGLALWPASVVTSAVAEPGRMVRVYDADTVITRLGTVRIVGLNAPERGARALCDAERRLAERAKARLEEIVRAGAVIYQVPCSCPPGTEGTMVCNYGRLCGTLLLKQRDVADIMISEGLAVPYRCEKTHCPPAPRPWCG